MRKWNATMPREKAAVGAAQVVLAYRNEKGIRVELEATMACDDAQSLMKQAIDMMQAYKPQKD